MSIGWSILISFLVGGSSGGIVSLLLKTYLKTKTDKSLEKYKSNIRNLEFVFPKKLDALNAIYSFKIELSPIPHYPDMDWYEACDNIAHSFDIYETNIINLLKQYGSVLPKNVIKKLEAAESCSTYGKFEINDKYQVSKQGNEYADSFVKHIDEAIDLLKKNLNIHVD